jgi:transposase
VVQVDEKERIRNAYYLQEQSIREIARSMRHSRKTVRKALSDPLPPVYTRVAPAPSPVMGLVKGIIDKWIEEDKTRPRKQRHTAHRVYERLRDEHGFSGAESSVRRYVRSLKKRMTELYVPLSFEPGRDAQADFGEAMVEMDGVERKVDVFCLQLCKSHRRFVMALPFQKQEAFLEAHVRAFDFFAAVPRRITYDNLTTATARAIRGDKRREIDSFIGFRSHYLFESHFCNPSEPQEKGQIENLVGYARRNWFVPMPKAKDFAELNAYLLAKCIEDDKHVVHGMRENIGDMFAREKDLLLPLPDRPYDCFRLHPVRSNKMNIICFERNSYSVPGEYASRNLFAKAYFDRIEITDAKRVVAIHKRLYGTGGESLDPVHYLEALKRKPGSVEYARPLKNSEFSPVYFRFLDRLKESMPESGARKAFLKVFELSAAYPQEMVAEAMELSLLYGSLDGDAVKNLLVQMNSRTATASPATLPEGLSGVRVEVRDVRLFDGLLSEVGG